MTLSNGFRRLATVLEDLEADGMEVLDVATDDDPDERLTVNLTVTIPLDGGEHASDGPLPAQSDGGGAPSDRADPKSDDGPDAVERDGVLDSHSMGVAENGASRPTSGEYGDVVSCPVADCDETFASGHGMKIHRTKIHGAESDCGDAGTPGYRDPDRLREVFAACDSFTEMRDALETDVSAQTVRRQMIAHGIYDPDCDDPQAGASESDDSVSDETGSDGSGPDASATAEDDAGEEATDEEPEDHYVEDDGLELDDEVGRDDDAEETVDEEANADQEENADDGDNDEEEIELAAIELPEGVTVADLKAAVAESKTLYDVQQRFDLDRDDSMALLERYDLLGIVHGRVSNRDERKDVDEAEITRRILEHVPGPQAQRV